MEKDDKDNTTFVPLKTKKIATIIFSKVWNFFRKYRAYITHVLNIILSGLTFILDSKMRIMKTLFNNHINTIKSTATFRIYYCLKTFNDGINAYLSTHQAKDQSLYITKVLKQARHLINSQ